MKSQFLKISGPDRNIKDLIFSLMWALISFYFFKCGEEFNLIVGYYIGIVHWGLYEWIANKPNKIRLEKNIQIERERTDKWQDKYLKLASKSSQHEHES